MFVLLRNNAENQPLTMPYQQTAVSKFQKGLRTWHPYDVMYCIFAVMRSKNHPPIRHFAIH